MSAEEVVAVIGLLLVATAVAASVWYSRQPASVPEQLHDGHVMPTDLTDPVGMLPVPYRRAALRCRLASHGPRWWGRQFVALAASLPELHAADGVAGFYLTDQSEEV